MSLQRPGLRAAGSMAGGLIFIAVAVVLLAVAGTFAVIVQQRLARWERAKATVVEVEYAVDENGYRLATPVFEFIATSGEVVEVRPFTSRSTSAGAGGVHRGDELALYYNPASPHTIMVADFMTLWFLPAVAGGLGAVFAIAAGVWCAAVLRGPRRGQAEPDAGAGRDEPNAWDFPGDD